MTEHSLEELKRQMEDARQNKANSDTEYNSKAKQYRDAFAALFIGKIASSNRISIVIREVEFAGDEPSNFVGRMLMKTGMPTMHDGKVHAKIARISQFLNADTGELV